MSWNQFVLAPDGSAVPSSRIAGVSRIPNSMEFWWIASNGSVQGAFFYDGGNWGRYELAPAGSASTAGGITAVSRIPASMELWFVGANGSVQDHYYYDDPVVADVKTFDQGVTTTIAVGGSAHVVMKKDGSFTFSSHAHDSGFDNISYTVTAAMLTADGIVFTFQHSGHTEGTVAGLPFGTPNRDDDFAVGGVNAQITTEWPGVLNGTFKASIAGTDTLAEGVVGALGDLVKELLAEAEKAAAAAVIALVAA